jgi:5-formyltetrahydrofolate cyclo-ligase
MESTKHRLRLEMTRRRSALDAETVALAGRLIAARLTCLPSYREAAVVLAYLAKDNEVPTDDLLAGALAAGKEVYLPRAAERAFARYEVGGRLEKGPLGTLEPASAAFFAADRRDGVVLVPLLAWTAQGDRLGRGGGWYDRILPRLGLPAIGIAYESQQRVHVPIEPSDVPLDFVVTENRIIECGRVLSDGRLT